MYYKELVFKECNKICDNNNRNIFLDVRISNLERNLEVPCYRPTHILDRMGKLIGFLCPYTNSLYTYSELYSQLIPYFERKVIFTLGMDCEFEELARGDVYYPVSTRFKSLKARIGCDGYRSILELRPEHGNPMVLQYNLEKLLKKIRHIPISVRGDCYPLGAHIHIGFVDQFYRNKLTYTYIVEHIDSLFGDLVELSGKARDSYKKRKAWREQEWGVEYRTFPSAILYKKRFLRFLLSSINRLINDIFYPVPVDMSWTKEVKATISSFMEEYLADYNNKKPMTINKEWTNCDPLLRVRFNDEWNSLVKDWVTKQLLFKIPLSTEITLFGLKEDRGMVVSGIGKVGGEIYPGVKVIEHEKSQSNEYCFGIPYKIRVNGVRQYMKLWRKIFQLIEEKLIKLEAKEGKRCV